MTIFITNLKPLLKPKSATKEFLTVQVDNIIINDCTIVHPDGKDPFLGMPKREYTNKDGQKKWQSIVVLPDEIKKEVNDKAVAAYKSLDDSIPF